MDTERTLTDGEKAFLLRIAGRKNLFLTFSVLSVVVAVSFLLYHALIARDLTSPRAVIVLLLLLSGRSHLRQYRSAGIIGKLKPWLID